MPAARVCQITVADTWPSRYISATACPSLVVVVVLFIPDIYRGLCLEIRLTRRKESMSDCNRDRAEKRERAKEWEHETKLFNIVLIHGNAITLNNQRSGASGFTRSYCHLGFPTAMNTSSANRFVNIGGFVRCLPIDIYTE